MKKAKPGVNVRIRGLGMKLVPGYQTDVPGLTAWNAKESAIDRGSRRSPVDLGKRKKPWQLIHQASGYVVWSFRLQKELEQGVWLIGDLLDWEAGLDVPARGADEAERRLAHYDRSFLPTLDEWLAEPVPGQIELEEAA